jgi:type IV secretion system protein VirD4
MASLAWTERHDVSVFFSMDGPALVIAGVVAAAAWAGIDHLANRHWRHESGTAYGAAAWASKHDLELANLFSQDGVILGRAHGKLLRYQTDRHLLTLAPNRSGKGVSSIIPNLLTWEGSAVVIDPKGENTAVTARRRREMGQDVHVLDSLGITGHKSSRYNPLLWLDPERRTFVEDAALIADTLHMAPGPKDDAFFLNESKAWVAGIIMHIVTTEPPASRTLGTLRALLTGTEEDFLTGSWTTWPRTSARTARRRAPQNRLKQKADRERSGVISTAQAETHIFDSPSMVEATATSDFDLSLLKRGAMTIYLVLPAEYLATHVRWLRLMIALCLAATTHDRTSSRLPVLFMLDEFAALGRLDAIETAMGLAAGFGVRL